MRGCTSTPRREPDQLSHSQQRACDRFGLYLWIAARLSDPAERPQQSGEPRREVRFDLKNRTARSRRIAPPVSGRSTAQEARSSPCADSLPRFVDLIRTAPAAIPDGPNPLAQSRRLYSDRGLHQEDGRNTRDFLLPAQRPLFPEAFD